MDVFHAPRCNVQADLANAAHVAPIVVVVAAAVSFESDPFALCHGRNRIGPQHVEPFYR